MPSIHTLDVLAAHLHYEVRGSGPLLLVLGHRWPPRSSPRRPTRSQATTRWSPWTARHRGQPARRPRAGLHPDLRADDVAAILDDLGAEIADVFGSGGGAVTGMALVARHPKRVGTLVAREPRPCWGLLPDAAARQAETDDIIESFHREGHGQAFMKFMATAGFDLEGDGAPTPPPGEPSARDISDGDRILGHELRPTTRYLPDIAALATGPARVVVGIGATSGGLLTYRTSAALAELLDTPMAEFPGDHGGFLAQPVEFAGVLRKVLACS